MKLSIVIVNYNVEYFLEQCLRSVEIACKTIDSEVFVVDNNSVDGSLNMIKEKFPHIHLIANKENLGFSKANNQAIRLAQGDYLLLLNPDTVVENDTFHKIIDFMETHSDVGGLGVKMIDGKGNFLPESKRGLPTPEVAFYKIFGLSKIFPNSKRFGKYHLSYLDNNQIHEIEILAGAFMLIRKSVLDKIGYLDEDFFMYGEDIDLSYRIIKAGYKNIYFPETRIIHYKGESTKKSSVNYVFIFYNAMIIFARKHFTQKNAKLFSSLINLAIYFRASLSVLKRFLSSIFLPVLDISLIWIGFYFLKNYWAYYFFSVSYEYYPPIYIGFIVPIYIFFWFISFYLVGGYERPHKLLKVIQGVFIGTIAILVVYALQDINFRYSRALILLGAIWSTFAMLFVRYLLHFSGVKAYRIGEDENKRFIVVGDTNEAVRVADLLRKTDVNIGFIGLVNIESNQDSPDFIGDISQINDIIDIYHIDEVIFCSKSLSASEIISYMSDLKSKTIDYKIAPPESLFLIGSNSINTYNDLYVIDINAINKPSNKRNKRMIDLFFSLFFLIFYPVLFIIQKKPFRFLINILSVIFSLKSWVGYNLNLQQTNKLPNLKNGVLNTCDLINFTKLNSDTISRLNLLYSRDYKVKTDVLIILKNIRDLGR